MVVLILNDLVVSRCTACRRNFCCSDRK
jgi:hypothetical protein